MFFLASRVRLRFYFLLDPNEIIDGDGDDDDDDDDGKLCIRFPTSKEKSAVHHSLVVNNLCTTISSFVRSYVLSSPASTR